MKKILFLQSQTQADHPDPCCHCASGSNCGCCCSDDAPSSWQIQNTMFLPEFQMHPDVFEITGEAGQLTVKNISDKAVSGEVYVYYKNSGADLFYGGITYRARVEGGLEPGESKQIIAAHYAPTTSAILMVSYIP